MLALVLFVAASSDYPAAVQQYLTLDRAPSCTLCHTSAGGGSGTAQKPFALSAIANGLVPRNINALHVAIDALDAAGTDSDGDGVSDIDELHAGTDPNVAGAAGAGGGGGANAPVQYGVGCASTPVEPAVFLALLALLPLIAAPLARRRRSSRLSSSRLSQAAASLNPASRERAAAVYPSIRRGLPLLAMGAVVVVAGGCTFAGGIGGTGDPVPAGFTEAPPETTCGSGLYWTRGNEESPNMHPGLDCIACHTSGGEEEGPRFALAGTVMTDMNDEDDCLGVGGVTVDILDKDGNVALTMQSNGAGNFYSDARLPSTSLPYTVRLTHEGRTSVMATPQTVMSCASCHTAAGANGAPGRVVAP